MLVINGRKNWCTGTSQRWSWKKQSEYLCEYKSKKLMGSWHPDYNPKLHRYKYLHGSVMMACGYWKWIVWRDNGLNWNKLCTGTGYYSSGLVVCDKDHQGFSDIPPGQIRDMTATIWGIVKENVSGKDNELQQDLSTTGLASNIRQTNMQHLFITIK